MQNFSVPVSIRNDCKALAPFSGAAFAGRRKGRQQGFDLLQIAIVVVVIGVMMAGVFSGVPIVLAKLRANQEAQDLLAYVDAQDMLSWGSGSVSLVRVIQARAYPESRVEGNKIINRFGGEVSISGGGNGQLIEVASPRVTSRACAYLIPMVALSFDEIVVQPVRTGAVIVKSKSGGLVNPDLVSRACYAAPLVTMKYRF